MIIMVYKVEENMLKKAIKALQTDRRVNGRI